MLFTLCFRLAVRACPYCSRFFPFHLLFFFFGLVCAHFRVFGYRRLRDVIERASFSPTLSVVVLCVVHGHGACSVLFSRLAGCESVWTSPAGSDRVFVLFAVFFSPSLFFFPASLSLFFDILSARLALSAVTLSLSLFFFFSAFVEALFDEFQERLEVYLVETLWNPAASCVIRNEGWNYSFSENRNLRHLNILDPVCLFLQFSRQTVLVVE